MKSLRLLALATCCAAAFGAVGSAAACDSKNSASAASASAASDCCATKGAKAGKSSKVKASAASASAAAMDCCMTKGATTTAVAANNAAAMDCCMSKGASATMASNASNVSKSADHCAVGAAKGTHASHASHAATKAGASCGMNSHSAMAMDCSTCDDWAMCESQVQSTGARSQVVALKNGVMIVYTAEAPEGVRAVQAAVARRTEGMKNSLASRKADAKLCPDCKQMRGALASGKLHREVVNVEKGAMDLLTSTDKSIVQMIHTMTGAQIAAR